MLLTMLKSKLHRATVTGADLDYEGSIAIDRDLLDLSGILPHEQVDVFNINTGGRFTPSAIGAARGSRDVVVNGAAARLVQTGDKVIIVAYCQIPAEEARNYHPTVVVLGEGNEVKRAACGSFSRWRVDRVQERSAARGVIAEEHADHPRRDQCDHDEAGRERDRPLAPDRHA